MPAVDSRVIQRKQVGLEIVALQAEAGGLDKEEREAVLAASRYADAHWKEVQDDACDR